MYLRLLAEAEAEQTKAVAVLGEWLKFQL